MVVRTALPLGCRLGKALDDVEHCINLVLELRTEAPASRDRGPAGEEFLRACRCQPYYTQGRIATGERASATSQGNRFLLGPAQLPVYMSRMRWPLIAAAFALSGCPPSGSGGSSSGATTGEPVITCSRVGQSCLFAPGKLGLCVERTPPCEGSNCLVCQSQH